MPDEVTEEETEEETTAEYDDGVYSRLTGLPTTAEIYNKRPVGVMINNLKNKKRRQKKDMVLQTAFSLKDSFKKTDEELAEIAKNGDKDALEYLLNRYKYSIGR